MNRATKVFQHSVVNIVSPNFAAGVRDNNYSVFSSPKEGCQTSLEKKSQTMSEKSQTG